MTGKTHMVVGAAASIFLLPRLGYSLDVISIISAAIGGLVPDMDHPKARINQTLLPIKNKLGKMLVYSGTGVFIIYYNSFKIDYITLAGILFIIIGVSRHRSFTHSILGIGLMAVVSFFVLKPFVSMPVIMAFITGIVSHMLADYITKEGVELFFPFTDKNYSFFIKTTSGSLIEKGILAFLIIFISKSMLIGVI